GYSPSDSPGRADALGPVEAELVVPIGSGHIADGCRDSRHPALYGGHEFQPSQSEFQRRRRSAPTHHPLAARACMRRHRCPAARRRGLAPPEMVLAIPILLFVVGLTVIFGVVTCWKVRGQLACRDAVWSTRNPRWGTG